MSTGVEWPHSDQVLCSDLLPSPISFKVGLGKKTNIYVYCTRGSVILKKGQKVIVATVWKVRWPQV